MNHDTNRKETLVFGCWTDAGSLHQILTGRLWILFRSKISDKENEICFLFSSASSNDSVTLTLHCPLNDHFSQGAVVFLSRDKFGSVEENTFYLYAMSPSWLSFISYQPSRLVIPSELESKLYIHFLSSLFTCALQLYIRLKRWCQCISEEKRTQRDAVQQRPR